MLWSGVGGQLLSYHLPCHLLWSGVGGQLLSYHFGGLYCMSSLEGPFRGAFGKRLRTETARYRIIKVISVDMTMIQGKLGITTVQETSQFRD